jgi:hypothetical protein
MDAFSTDKVGGSARVIMVCPLYLNLLHLILSVTCTCGCFDSAWVSGQWERIDSIWKEDCLQVVGSIIGHASDGDSHRRQLMLADYLTTIGSRFRVP